MTSTFTLTALKQYARDPKTVAIAAEYRRLEAAAKAMRLEVDAIYRPIFAKYEFLHSRTSEPITYEENHLYMCGDEAAVAAYFAEINAAIQERSYGLPDGSCPALTAEHAVIKQENLILKEFSEFLGTPRPVDLKPMAEMVRLFLQAVELEQPKL